MRIIAGSARGRPLQAPPKNVRPTMDRVRGAIFSSLGDLVPAARVLDLFAGSGAMGIEALSRGAESATFIESHEHCARCIRENLRRTGLSGNVQIMDVMRFIDLYLEENIFDLIFADPPYRKTPNDIDYSSLLVSSEKLAAALKQGGLFVLEKQREGVQGVLPDSPLELLKRKRYGGSEIVYLRQP